MGGAVLFNMSKKILILVNTLTEVNKFVYANHIHFFTHTIRKYPDFQFAFYTPARMSIDNARNTAARMALESECDYLMFIDDDVLLPTDTFTKLYEADKAIIAGLVIIRGYPFNVMAFKTISDENTSREKIDYYNDLPEDGDKNLVELVKCRAVGFSCCLLKVDVLKALEPPYFVTGTGNTEDVYFCLRTQHELDPAPDIYMHTGVRCGHLLHPEPVEWETRDKLKAFYEPIIKEQSLDVGRNVEYLNQCLAQIK